MAAPRGKKRVRKNISTGVVHIRSTFNNTMVTITDEKGKGDAIIAKVPFTKAD